MKSGVQMLRFTTHSNSISFSMRQKRLRSLVSGTVTAAMALATPAQRVKKVFLTRCFVFQTLNKSLENILDETRRGLFAPFTLPPLLYHEDAFYIF